MIDSKQWENIANWEKFEAINEHGYFLRKRLKNKSGVFKTSLFSFLKSSSNAPKPNKPK